MSPVSSCECSKLAYMWLDLAILPRVCTSALLSRRWQWIFKSVKSHRSLMETCYVFLLLFIYAGFRGYQRCPLDGILIPLWNSRTVIWTREHHHRLHQHSGEWRVKFKFWVNPLNPLKSKLVCQTHLYCSSFLFTVWTHLLFSVINACRLVPSRNLLLGFLPFTSHMGTWKGSELYSTCFHCSWWTHKARRSVIANENEVCLTIGLTIWFREMKFLKNLPETHVPQLTMMLPTLSVKPWENRLGTSSSTISILRPLNSPISCRQILCFSGSLKNR